MNPNEAASPQSIVNGPRGFTKREQIAVLAAQAMCGPIWPSDEDMKEIARRAFVLADALIAASQSDSKEQK